MKKIPKELLELLEYEPSSGIIRWKVNRTGTARAGSIAGSKLKDGYICIGYKGKRYKAHRVAWALHTGNDPSDLTVEHRDRNRSNNAISNLMLLEQSLQNYNQGALGYAPHHKHLRAYMTHKGKNIHIGTSDCPLIARILYHSRVTEMFPHMTVPFVPSCTIVPSPKIEIAK